MEVPRPGAADLRAGPPGEPTATVAERVRAARAVQERRYAGTPFRANADLTGPAVRRWCEPTAEGGRLLELAIDRLGLSVRAHDRILKVARTLADLAGAETIDAGRVAEAIGYRELDRPVGGG